MHISNISTFTTPIDHAHHTSPLFNTEQIYDGRKVDLTIEQ